MSSGLTTHAATHVHSLAPNPTPPQALARQLCEVAEDLPFEAPLLTPFPPWPLNLRGELPVEMPRFLGTLGSSGHGSGGLQTMITLCGVADMEPCGHGGVRHRGGGLCGDICCHGSYCQVTRVTVRQKTGCGPGVCLAIMCTLGLDEF